MTAWTFDTSITWPLTTACLLQRHQPQCSCLLVPAWREALGFQVCCRPAELICQVGLTVNVTEGVKDELNSSVDLMSGTWFRTSSPLPPPPARFRLQPSRERRVPIGATQREAEGTAEVFSGLIVPSEGLTNRSR